MEKTIRILGIAPYEALRAAMVKIAKNRPDLSVDIYLGNMKEGVDIAKFHQNENYDVIISRGATARKTIPTATQCWDFRESPKERGFSATCCRRIWKLSPFITRKMRKRP